MFETKEVSRKVGVPAYKILKLQKKINNVALVIPVLNEENRLSLQLQKIKENNVKVDIVIADGGSSDNSTSPSKLALYDVTTLLVKVGRGGLSSQLRMAIDFCLEYGYQAIITMDGNNKDDAKGIQTLLDSLNEGFDFVQGSRFIKGGRAINTPVVRYLAIRLIHSPLTSLFAHRKFTDSTNGFRAYSMRFLSHKEVSPCRDVFDTYELIAYLPIKASKLGFRITEVPVTREYPNKGPIPTKINGLKSHLNLLRILINCGFGKYNV